MVKHTQIQYTIRETQQRKRYLSGDECVGVAHEAEQNEDEIRHLRRERNVDVVQRQRHQHLAAIDIIVRRSIAATHRFDQLQ